MKISIKMPGPLMIVLIFGFFLWPELGVNASLYAHSQLNTIKFEHFSTWEGFPQSSVLATCQDKRGYLWFATEDGLNRYDGDQFTVFRANTAEDNSLSNGFIWALCADPTGVLWIGTGGGGLNRCDPKTGTFTAYQTDSTNPGGLSDNFVRALLVDKEGILWIGTENGGLNRFDPQTETFVHYTGQSPAASANQPGNNFIRTLYEDSRGRLWVGTKGSGLAQLDRETNTLIYFPNPDGDGDKETKNAINTIHEFKPGLLWLGTDDGLYQFAAQEVDNLRRGEFSLLPLLPGEPHSVIRYRVSAILRDRSGMIWIGTANGLFLLDPKEMKSVHLQSDPGNRHSLNSNYIWSLAEDRSGVLWIGTRGGGLNKYSFCRNRFPHFRLKVNPSSQTSVENVLSFYETANEREDLLWIGTDNGLVQLDRHKNEMTHYGKDCGGSNPISREWIRGIQEDPSGMLWLGTHSGLVRLDPSTKKFLRYQHDPYNPNSLSNNFVHTLYIDPAGPVWIGTRGGLNRFDPEAGVFTRYQQDPGDPGSLGHNIVYSIQADAWGHLWLGTMGGGLERFSPPTGKCESFRHHPDQPNSLSDDTVLCILVDTPGTNHLIWVGTTKGLNKFDPQRRHFTRYGGADGLSNDVIYGILKDNATGNLWLSTNYGLSMFNPQSGQFTNYDIRDGLQSNEFNGGAYFRSRSGELFFGGINGFNAFFPRDIISNPHIPPVVLQDFKVMNKTVPPGKWSDKTRDQLMLDQSTAGTAAVRLSYKDYYFSFRFAALDYHQPQKNQYAYKLEGFNDDWIRTDSSQRYALFSNLSPGTYTFKVKASNNDGAWNKTGASISIVIIPPFWKTWWFKGLAGFSFLVVLYLFYRLRIYRHQVQRKKLEGMIKTRTVELRNKKNELEKINNIVKSINNEIDLSSLMSAILEESKIIRGVERAVAFAFDKENNLFEIVASSGWEFEQVKEIRFTAGEMQGRYLTDSIAIAEDIFIVKNIKGRVGEEKVIHLQLPKTKMVMQIKIAGEVKGYLVFDNMQYEDAFEIKDIQLLTNLREHFFSAFIKATIMEDLKTLNEKKNQFLGMAAHDLRSPLTEILGYLSLVIYSLENDTFNKPKGLNDLYIAAKAVERMTHLVNELLDVSAIESGKVNLKMQPEDYNKILETVVRFYARMAEQKNITLFLERGEKIPGLTIDKNKILEVMDNLLSNAVKYTYPGGWVKVYYQVKEGEVLTFVEDSGQGIDPEELKDLFKGFKKLSSVATGGESRTGLGLVITKKIVDLHQGKISTRSVKGKGTTFIFSLPLG